MNGLASRLQGFGSSIFAEMTQLAVRLGAINLGQGFPDTDGPPAMMAAAKDAIDAGHNQYPPVRGIMPLREAVAMDRERLYGTAYDPATEVLISTGATCGLAAAFLALCEPGDEVLVFDPCYDAYPAMIAMAGGIEVPVRLHVVGDRFAFDPAELRAAVTPRTRMLMLNNPSNPTGKVFTREELAEIAAVCVEHDLIAVTDEVHEHLVFDGAKAISLAAFPGMRDRTVAVSGAGKTFSVTGWKVGWVCGSAEIVQAVQVAHQFLTFNSGTPFQVAVAGALADPAEWIAQLRSELQAQRDFVVAGLEKTGMRTLRCEGTYFVQADVRPLGYEDATEFCRDLPGRTGVVAIPSVAFYRGPNPPIWLVRFAFCKQPEVLTRAMAAIQSAAA